MSMIPKRWKYGATFYGLYLVSRFPSQILRHAVYRAMGMKIGTRSVIYGRVEIRHPRGIVIGKGCSIGHDSILDGRGGLTIGDNVNFSTGVWVWTSDHDAQSPSFAGRSAPVAINDYAWLGGRVIVLPGVTLGRGAVAASGSVVTKDVPPHTIVAGIPARQIGTRNPNLNYSLEAVGPFM